MKQPIDITNYSALQYNQAVSSQFVDVSQPFLESSNINTFIYTRFFYDGSFLVLSNSPVWHENLLFTLPSIRGSVLYSIIQEIPLTGLYYRMWLPDPSDKVITFSNRFGVWNGFSVCRRLEDSAELWSFGTEHEDINFYNFYVNNTNLLDRFCLYFNEKSSDIINPTETNRLAVLKEELNFAYQENLSYMQKCNEIIGLTNIKKYPLKTKYGSTCISKREFECMFYLSQGKTAKEIGRSLNLSYRTIQFYIENIKRKTGYQSRSALGDLFRESLQKWW